MSWQMPGIDWRWLKAQCYQESRFNSKAVSPVGASGVCQFMPGTWRDVPNFIKSGQGVFDARTNIEAAAWYDSKLYRFWYSPRPVNERIKLMLASYNAGAGHIANAQRKCSMAVLYDPIIKCLPDITGHHSKETINYVKTISKFYRRLTD